MSCESCDYLKSRVRELESINQYIKPSTISSIINKLSFLRDERAKTGLPVYGIQMSIDVVRGMKE